VPKFWLISMNYFSSASGYPPIARRLFRGILTLVLAFLLSASLLRFAPGWNVEETDMDARFSTSTVKEIRGERAVKRGLVHFYVSFLGQLISGDLGTSELFGRPVRELIAERATVTLRSVSIGLLAAWIMALGLAAATSRDKSGIAAAGAATFSGALLSCPSGLIAVLCLAVGLPPAWAIMAVVFPRAFPHAHEQLRNQFRATHVLMARSRGIGGLRLYRSHIVPGVLPALTALAGASVPLAFGAAIPIESLGDSPGLGQLAWRAALGRDMPLLVSLTLLLTAVSVTANLASDAALTWVRGRG
jgi:peptide/nickel transport system permease protein